MLFTDLARNNTLILHPAPQLMYISKERANFGIYFESPLGVYLSLWSTRVKRETMQVLIDRNSGIQFSIDIATNDELSFFYHNLTTEVR